ncbi:NAD(P)/FAD-dependent oxidoreductase [Amphritea pacifica]|uniref:NAD(P)/FAD-dependent oxidoreductase n=1 Tax=Amphritea pacifica TaxID=2811233 RepID=UPI001963B862|nr:FAD-binding oxidoreductase [Amphritea pacifica]MBN1006056.1 FAD-binding oxidoreductase [Amphritea pacifica]
MNSHHDIRCTLPDSLWAESASPAPLTTPFQGQKSASVVIIGGGYTGLSTALHLAEKGVDVILLEAQEIGFGGSGRNVGLVNAGLWVSPDEVEATLGATYGERLNTQLAGAPDLVFSLIERFGIPCEAVRNGTLHLSHSARGDRILLKRAHQLQTRGAPVDLKDQATTARLTGTNRYRSSLFDPRAGTIQPLSYARGLAHAAQSLGARIYTGSAVTGLRNSGDGEWTVNTANGSVIADQVVIATNAYSGHLHKPLQQSFIPLFFFQYATRPLAPELLEKILPQKHGCWDTRQVMSSIRLDNSGRLIIGSIGNVTDTGNEFLQSWASHQLSRLFPDCFKQSEISHNPDFWSHGWSGRIAFSNDHLPHLHSLAPGLTACIGYSGRGIGPGTMVGKSLADYLTGMPLEEMFIPVTQLKPITARRTREQYYARGADLYHLYQRII